jgi:hypothetical protein
LAGFFPAPAGKKQTMNTIAIESIELVIADIRTRLPFKYGIATMVDVPHVFVRVVVRTPAGVCRGASADHLPPKWFTKDPTRSIAGEIDDMMAVVVHAATAARSITAPTVFRFWRELWSAQEQWARTRGFPPLLAQFGTSLIERALIEAVARGQGGSFHSLLHAGHFGVELGEIHPELAGARPADLLPRDVAEAVQARHTVGLADPLTDAEIAPAEKLSDGLPQALEASIRRYGLRHFKIKIDGTAPETALARLKAVFAVLSREVTAGLAFTIDGNECFTSVGAFRDFWARLIADEAIRPLLRQLLFVEQPLARSVALDPARADLRAWPDRPPIIIDESDAECGDLRRALDLGYAGTSHKNCKGVFKGVAHACLISQRTARSGGRLIMSGEDLCSIGPVSMLQDLAVQAVLGVASVERNGHHYFAGLSPWPQEIQAAVLAHHPDLYETSGSGWPRLTVREGRLSTRSVIRAPLGVGVEMPFDRIPGRRIAI